MAEQRFIVTEIWGWPITRGAHGSGTKRTPSYSVIDTANAHREVGSFYSEKGYAVKVNERRAYALCRQLNRTEHEWENQFPDNVFA